MNYRKLYAEYFNIEIPSEYDIHHIDFDLTNNNIDNLILLPKSLHRKYHWVLNHFNSPTNKTLVVYDAKIRLEGNNFDVSALRRLGETMEEIEKWRIKKNNADYDLYCRGGENGRTLLQGDMDS